MERLNSSQHHAEFFRASCTSAEMVGKLVYIAGPKSGGLVPVRLTEPSDIGKMPGSGLIVFKYNTTECLVQQSGQVPGLFGGLEEGKTYKAGNSGDIQRLAPTAAAGGYAWVQFIGHAVAEDVLYLNPEMRMVKRLP